MYPRYALPACVVLGLARDVLLRRGRSFESDATACIRGLQPRPSVTGREYVDPGGSYVITPNHYFRDGFASQWSALAISASLPMPVHWIMTAELTFPGKWYAPAARPLSRFVLARIARLYGFTSMPPMPPRPADVAERAASVRAALAFARSAPHVVVGLAPEGGDQPGGRLSMPAQGLGRFCLLLAAAGRNFLPVAVFECEGALNLRFGPPHKLERPTGRSSAEADHEAAFAVMSHIAALLPTKLRGEFC